MIESATLSPAERSRRDIERLRQERKHPSLMIRNLQLHLASLL